MLRIYLLTFIGLVISTNSPSLDGTSLLGMIRNDPNALVKIFETATADKDKVGKILQLLNNLVDEGNQEILSITDSIANSKKAVDDALDSWQQAVGVENSRKIQMTSAQRAVSAARGRLIAVQKLYDIESPGLEKEVAVFTKVLNILTNLLNGNNPEEAESEELKAFISVADQADPVKVNKIIEMINNLNKVSTDELNILKNKLQTAKNDVSKLIVAQNKAAGLYDAAVKDTLDKRSIYDKAVGSHNILSKTGQARQKVINDELTTLDNVIELLKKLQ